MFKHRKWITFVFLGASPAVLSSADVFAAKTTDTRVLKLRSFFEAYGCPQPDLAAEYVSAADAYSIDYRLLPALSVRETTCGEYQRRNNLWGWDSARTGFQSVSRGIDFILSRLAGSRYYRGKNLDQKLHVYNPNPNYPHEVRQLMREIDSD